MRPLNAASHPSKMPRTRSGKSPTAEQIPEVVTAEDSQDGSDVPPPSTFKGHIDKFQYDARTNRSIHSYFSVATLNAGKRSRTTTTNNAVSSPSPAKKRKGSSYAPPSKYSHLSPLTDILEPNLICVFVGTNPGVQTATAGHAYAHPSNQFWKLLHASGLTDRRLRPEEDVTLPALYCMGNTNIVDRPSKDAAELSKEETAAGTANLDAKFLKYKPEAVLIVGKGIWEAIWRYRYGRNPKASEFKYGWQDDKHNMGKSARGTEELGPDGQAWKGSRVFVTTSTSGLAQNLKPAEKEAIWKPFGDWVLKRRSERDFVARPLSEAEKQGRFETKF
ncbi:G/U mismatch-specific DNA glycosylase [Polyplosphaeria fusca]|uniref:G/U mismatch-specific DNA glycosylase n=1 Tax=Polyplosphaeria fusca TaxID=682080 RepID=A0A9P4V4S6_9PLEO|nr:G/U mismatch-specific DNA glycosylase [Polyplosphaeria fusca]